VRRYYDVTLPFSADLPAWPSEPAPRITRIKSQDRGDAANVTQIETHVHFGTHLDAPGHFLKNGGMVETLDLDDLIGPAWLADATGADAITADVLEQCAIPGGVERLLCRTDNSALWDDMAHPFFEDFVAISADGAGWLVERGIRLVGVDYLSVESYHTADYATHTTLLGAGVVAVEGLDLRAVPTGLFELACLPMKIAGADGAPARVVLWRDE